MNLSLPLDETGTPPALNAAPTRAAGLARLADYLPLAGQSIARMQFRPRPGEHALVSTLSPWIRHRLVTEQKWPPPCFSAMPSAPPVIQECAGAPVEGLAGTAPLGLAAVSPKRRPRARRSRGWRSRRPLASAEAGATGIAVSTPGPMVRDTGYLHNHARMWFASIWIFTLGLPWALGADFFLRHLLDGDAASNTLSWRWVAGLQTEGKAYIAGADNIAKFTDGRFRPAGQLTGRAAPWPSPPIRRSARRRRRPGRPRQA